MVAVVIAYPEVVSGGLEKVEQIDELLKNNTIESPIAGMVLTKYMNEGEFAVTGKPIFKMASLDTMILKTYITGDQLPRVKNGQQVKVFIELQVLIGAVVKPIPINAES